MEPITFTLIGITLLFFVVLAIKSILKAKKLCVICTSTALAWIILSTFYFLNLFSNKIIIAILIGHTSLGIYYMMEKKVRKRFLFFRLPYLLTSIWLIYFILEGFVFNSLYVIFVLWLLFIIIYLFKFSKFTKKIIDCCKKW